MAVKNASRSAGSRATIPQLSWDRVTPAPVVLVTGPETLLAERAMRSVREQLREADPSLEVSDIDAGQYAPGELLTLASPSLFAEPRLIRVSQVEKCTDAFLEETLAYLAAPADDTVLVLRHGGGVRGKKLLDGIRGGLGGGIEIVCAELKRESDRIDFAAAEFRTAQRKATPGAVRSLAVAFSEDLAELAAACRQLIADTDGEITEQVVDRYYAGRAEITAFAVADAAIAGHTGEALGLLRHALASGSDPVPMVAAFAMKIRTMAKLAGARGSSNDLARTYGLQAWQVDRARRDLQGWTDEGLATAIEALAATDADVKGASRDPVFALERLITLIAARGVTR